MKNSLSNSRKTIGILINEIDGWYGSLILKGIKEIALKRDINLLIFPGRTIKATWRDESQHNIIYNIVNQKKLDGLIITSASLFNFLDTKAITSFLHAFRGTPIVSISVEVTNTTSIILDNRFSMYSLVNHLIECHNYTRIAFITGPSSSLESNQRYEGYLDALKKHNIPLDLSYIAEGDFNEDSGLKAVEELFKNVNFSPQAIVASNDQMAIGASIKLKEMGFKIGKDIALTGFDNSDEIKFIFPPLTTVRQPAYEMGSMATEFICDLLECKQINNSTLVKGELIVRESCGCLALPYKKNIVNSDCLLVNNIDSLMLNKESIVLSALQELHIPPLKIAETTKTLVDLLDYLEEDIKAENIKGKFIRNLNYILSENVVLKNQAINWNNFMLSMRSNILEQVTDYKILSLVEDIFYSACILTNNILTRFESYDGYKFRKLFKETRHSSENFNTALCIEDLVKTLKNHMLKVSIQKCYLCLYDKPAKYLSDTAFILPSKVKLFLCHNEEEDPSIEYFDTEKMLPDKYLYLEERNELLFKPLFIGNLHFGYIVFSMNNNNENIYESLCEQISHSLNSQLLLNERKSAEKKLQIAVKKLEKYNHELHDISINDELTDLYNRRGFYVYSDQYYERAHLNNENFILFYGDLDGLKKINDNFGHKYGDEAIKAAGKLLKKSFRTSDIVSRLGGDEFTALTANNCSSNTLQLILERITLNFMQFNLAHILPFEISICIGFSIYEPSSHISFDELMQQADASLYKEKRLKKK